MTKNYIIRVEIYAIPRTSEEHISSTRKGSILFFHRLKPNRQMAALKQNGRPVALKTKEQSTATKEKRMVGDVEEQWTINGGEEERTIRSAEGLDGERTRFWLHHCH